MKKNSEAVSYTHLQLEFGSDEVQFERFDIVRLVKGMNSDSFPFDMYCGESTFTLTVRDISTKLI